MSWKLKTHATLAALHLQLTATMTRPDHDPHLLNLDTHHNTAPNGLALQSSLQEGHILGFHKPGAGCIYRDLTPVAAGDLAES